MRGLGSAAFIAGIAACTQAMAAPAATPAQQERLDSRQAMQAAQAAGLKTAVLVPNAVRCPEIAAPKADSRPLAAHGALAGLAVDIDGFLRADMDVPEAVAVLGRPVLCNRHTPGRYMEMYLAPRVAGLQEAVLETRDGELIGIILGFEKPVPVDLTALERSYGAAKKGPAPLDSFEAGSDDLRIENAAFRAQVMLSHRAASDPKAARQVHRVILRRTPMLQLLPEGFHQEQDVVRLLALTLAARAPDPVQLAGTIGVYSQPVNGRIAFGYSLPVRNVDRAATDITTQDGVHSVRTLTVTFKAPVPCTADGLARGLASLLKLPQPALKAVSGRMGMDIKDAAGRARGSVVLDFAGSALKTLSVERFDGP